MCKFTENFLSAAWAGRPLKVIKTFEYSSTRLANANFIFTEELRDHFGQYGEIESINVKTDPTTGRSRGFAFIVYQVADSIDKVVAAGDHIINNKKVDPKKAKARTGKIFVGGLIPEISDDEIKAYFGQFGNVSLTKSGLPLQCLSTYSSNFRLLKSRCHSTKSRTNAKHSASSHSIQKQSSMSCWRLRSRQSAARKSMLRKLLQNLKTLQWWDRVEAEATCAAVVDVEVSQV